MTVMAKKRAQSTGQGGSDPAGHVAAVVADPGTARSARTCPVRPVIEGIRPLVDNGRFPAKAAVGDVVMVEADVFADGHDILACDLRFRCVGERRWGVVPMEPLGNDRWTAGFPVDHVDEFEFEIAATVDEFATWRRDLDIRWRAGRDVRVDLLEGARLLGGAAERAKGEARRTLEQSAADLESASGRMSPGGPPGRGGPGQVLPEILTSALSTLVRANVPKEELVRSPACPVTVEAERARYGSWYELFPRSASPDPTRPGTLVDVIARLPYLERLGIDVLYLPPVHPIGTTDRKGHDGAATAGPGDPGSPWAIGSPAGGHTSIDPALGTLADFDELVRRAEEAGIGIALDLAFQCSPDHPWVHEHPEWFRHRPDGTIRFAENPPKQYQDIYPLDFEGEGWRGLWCALLDVVRFWISHGVSVFRVDNPHTKPLAFWEWLIASVKSEAPDVVFLAEAFTRPKLMYRLAKLGFSQSYTYFTWRNEKWELEAYLSELTATGVRDYLRPSLWPNTPDILTDALQTGRTAAFVSRLVLAATLAATYGIYGPPFELQVHTPVAPGSEEYADSEKYAVRHWYLDDPTSLAGLVARLNGIRRAHPALQRNETLRFHPVGNEHLIAYSKSHLVENRTWWAGGAAGPQDEPDVVLVVVNLDPTSVQSGWVDLDLAALGVETDRPFVVHDLLTNAFYPWQGSRNFVQLDPAAVPAHVFSVRRTDAPPAAVGAEVGA
jgi:starch synthase (maltosyl-transferring)